MPATAARSATARGSTASSSSRPISAAWRACERRGGLRSLEADICDLPRMRTAMAEFRPDAVMHLAAESHVDRSITGAADFIQTNINGTFAMLEAARDYFALLDAAGKAAFRFHHISTDEVFGSLGPTGAFSETTA